MYFNLLFYMILFILYDHVLFYINKIIVKLRNEKKILSTKFNLRILSTKQKNAKKTTLYDIHLSKFLKD